MSNMNGSMKSGKRLKKSIITEVVKFCNRDIVPDETFSPEGTYPSDWFDSYFSFIGEKRMQSQLGDAFYQARFMYKLMCALNLPLAKKRGIVKFQIVQYALICEAVLDIAILRFYKSEAEDTFSVVEYKPNNGAIASDTRISRNGMNLFICSEKKKKGELKRTRVDFKTKFAVCKGLITQDLKDRMDALYDLRNNIHIIKAAEAGYIPRLREAKDAFVLMREFVDHIKTQFQKMPSTNSNAD